MKNDLARFHGYNERISVRNYVEVVEFYHRLIRNSDTRLQSVEGEGSGEGSGGHQDNWSDSGSGDDILHSEDYQLMGDI